MIAKVAEVKHTAAYGSYLLFWPVKRFEFIFCGSEWFERKKTHIVNIWFICLGSHAVSVFFTVLDIQYHLRDWTASDGFESSFAVIPRFHCLLWRIFHNIRWDGKYFRRIWIDTLHCLARHFKPLGIWNWYDIKPIDSTSYFRLTFDVCVWRIDWIRLKWI